MERTDPPSTRCTFITMIGHAEVFDAGAPGDRIELHEERDAHPTGRVVTARVLGLQEIKHVENGKVPGADTSEMP